MTVSVQQLVARQIRLWEALKGEHPVPHTETPARPVITISREAGIDTGPLARRLAAQLGYSIWDQEIIDYVAQSSGIRRQFLEALEENTQTAVSRWVEGAVRGHLFDLDDYARALVHVIRALGEQGSAIIIGRGAHCIIPPEHAIRVRLFAPLGYRAEHAKQSGESVDAARKRLEKENQQREEFVSSTMKVDPRDPGGYDLLLNVARLGENTQYRMITELVHARSSHPAA